MSEDKKSSLYRKMYELAIHKAAAAGRLQPELQKLAQSKQAFNSPYEGWVLPCGLDKVPRWWVDSINSALFGEDKTSLARRSKKVKDLARQNMGKGK